MDLNPAVIELFNFGLYERHTIQTWICRSSSKRGAKKACRKPVGTDAVL